MNESVIQQREREHRVLRAHDLGPVEIAMVFLHREIISVKRRIHPILVR